MFRKWRARILLAFNSHLWHHKLTNAWSHSVGLQSILAEPQPTHVTDHILIVMHGLRSCYGVRIHGWHAGAFTLIVPQIFERSHQTIWKIIFDVMWYVLTHWGRVTHICVSKVTIIVSDNGLSPGRRQAIIWNNAGILLIGTLGTNFNEIFIEILTFSFKKMRLKVSSAKRQPLCLGLNVLN